MDENEKIIKIAQDLIDECGDGLNHTVASAVLCSDGSIVTGINLYHFNGGPCGEITALANVAAERKVPELIVAVADQGRGILSPCGRCRQVMFDYYPDISAIVLENGEPSVKKITELLPYVYDWTAEQAKV